MPPSDASPSAEPPGNARSPPAAFTVANVTAFCGGSLHPTASPSSVATLEKLQQQIGPKTPRRRPSFLEQQQQQQQNTQTPRGSMVWPSVHRSLSNAAATRDNSRHSQMADCLNSSRSRPMAASVTPCGDSSASGRYHRLASSASYTPRSSRDETIDCSDGGGGHRSSMRQRRVGSLCRRRVPPLIDVADPPLMGQYSLGQSVSTTAVVTPRDGSAIPAGGWVSAAPPMDDFEGKAAAMDRATLEAQVGELRQSNLVLCTTVLRDRQSLVALQDGLGESYAAAESRKEQMTNALLRRLERVKRIRSEKAELLRAAEQEKVAKEAKLRSTVQSIELLSLHLSNEEQVIGTRLQRGIDKLRSQRDELERVRAEQSYSLQQLRDGVQEMALVVNGGNGGAALAERPAAAAAAEVEAEAEATATTTTAAAHSVVPLATPPPPPPQQQQQQQPELVVQQHFEPGVGGEATTQPPPMNTAEVAGDLAQMVDFLEREILAVETLRGEAMAQAEQYTLKKERLERHLRREEAALDSQQSEMRSIQTQLKNTSVAANEWAAAHETAMEMELDRNLNGRRWPGDRTPSNVSSLCTTPQHRPSTSLRDSRGFLLSPTLSLIGGAPPSQSQCEIVAPASIERLVLPTSSSLLVPIRGDDSLHGANIDAVSLPRPSTDGTPHKPLLVHDTTRLTAPQPVTSADTTPKHVSLASPTLSTSQSPKT